MGLHCSAAAARRRGGAAVRAGRSVRRGVMQLRPAAPRPVHRCRRRRRRRLLLLRLRLRLLLPAAATCRGFCDASVRGWRPWLERNLCPCAPVCRPEAAIAEAFRVLRPGGVFGFTVCEWATIPQQQPPLCLHLRLFCVLPIRPDRLFCRPKERSRPQGPPRRPRKASRSLWARWPSTGTRKSRSVLNVLLPARVE